LADGRILCKTAKGQCSAGIQSQNADAWEIAGTEKDGGEAVATDVNKSAVYIIFIRGLDKAWDHEKTKKPWYKV
jgi:hypothetical protein